MKVQFNEPDYNFYHSKRKIPGKLKVMLLKMFTLFIIGGGITWLSFSFLMSTYSQEMTLTSMFFLFLSLVGIIIASMGFQTFLNYFEKN
jgi:hypothetical protein